MASPSLRDDFAATFELYSTFIKQLKAENPQLNVFEVSFAHGKVGKNSYGKRHSTGISNV
jgi:FMN-dependent NADH-azoreductase